MAQVRSAGYVFGEVPRRVFAYDFDDEGVPPVVGGGTYILLDTLQVQLNAQGELPLDSLVIAQSGGGIPLDTLTIQVQG